MLPVVSPSSLRDEVIVNPLNPLHETSRSRGTRSGTVASSSLRAFGAGPEHEAAESAEPAQCPAGAVPD